jgi:hypothetical protein
MIGVILEEDRAGTKVFRGIIFVKKVTNIANKVSRSRRFKRGSLLLPDGSLE